MSIVVLGSANIDVVIGLERIPAPGETVITDRSTLGMGGKGNNQAVAAARSGAPTQFIGAVGADGSGDLLLAGMREAGIDTELVRRCDDVTSGTAYVMVDQRAENAIVVVAGANGLVRDLGEREQQALRDADVLLMQLEVPIETVTAAARITHGAGGYVVLNAAPYAELPDDLIDAIDLLIVNEHEAALTAGMTGSPQQLAEKISQRVPAVLITLGAQGSLLGRRGSEPLTVSAPQVDAVDTTGAGDTFCGAYAAARLAGKRERDCLAWASAAAALAVQRSGAVSSIPSYDEISQAVARFYPA